MATPSETKIAAEIRPLVQGLSGYSADVWQLAHEAGLITRYGPNVVRACIAAFFGCMYLRPGPGALFHERAPLSAFKPNIGYELGQMLELTDNSSIACAREMLSLRVITITDDDSAPARSRGLSLTYEGTQAIIAPRIPTTLAEFGKTIDAIKSILNTYITETFCSDVPLMMKLLVVHDRIAATVARAVQKYIKANQRYFPTDVTDWNPFALKGGNVFKLVAHLRKVAVGEPSSLAGLSDYDFGINFPRIDDYYRWCNEKYKMSLPTHSQDEWKAARIKPEPTRDAKYYELYSIIFATLRTACRVELSQMMELGQKHGQLADSIERICSAIGHGLELLPNDVFYPLQIARAKGKELFMMAVATDAQEATFKAILGSRPQFNIDRQSPTRYYRLIEMDIADYSARRQGVHEEITKTGFRLARAQLAFNIRFALGRDLSIDKILFAEIFDYATPFMYAHDWCATVDEYEMITLPEAGVNIKTYSIPWFIEDVLSMITGGVESPKHAKRIVRIATLIMLAFDGRQPYAGRDRLRDYLVGRSPRDYIVKDKLLELMLKYEPGLGAADAKMIADAKAILAGL